MLVGVKSQKNDNRAPWVITGEENGRMYILLGGNGEPEVYNDRKEAEARALFISTGKLDPEPEPEPKSAPEPEPVRKGCFITTACEVALGKEFRDDGVELTTLRQHRDRMAAAYPHLDAKVREYYQKAPKIVANIDATADSEQRYREIFYSLVVPTNKLLEAGRDAEAVDFYYAGFKKLCSTYAV